MKAVGRELHSTLVALPAVELSWAAGPVAGISPIRE
jgi:hypothetical protein